MIRKILLLFIIIILSPACSKQEKKGTQAWPLEQSNETHYSLRSNHATQDFPVLGLVLLIGGLFIFSLIIISTRSRAKLSVEPFFMPHEGHKCLKSLYQDLRSAKEKICIASYWVTHSNIIMALIRARKRNVSIKIIFDRSSPNSATLEEVFRDTGLEFIESEIDSARMHHKFIIVDNNITWVGSANLTGTAFSKNYENMLRIESPETARRYLVDFRNLMKELEQSKELAKKLNI